MAQNNFADAQETSHHVAWSPSYGGSCQACDLRGRNMSGWDISRANYPDADLSDSLLRGTRATGVVFTNAIALNTDFRQATLDDAKFVDAHLETSRFDKASLRNADLSRAVMTQTKLRGAILTGATARRTDFSDSLAQRVDFSGANLANARFTNAKLSNAVFYNAVLTGATFDGADLTGANLSNMRLNEVNFEGAIGLETANFENSCLAAGTHLPDGIELAPCPPLEGTFALKFD
ncbi:pentapeptide repeat-containing protein [Henriciella sp. AS95]|uniref:pentapeptide repeat-containing protein n=1 Tax=Henriciella sp. AS95 TaxID=3135782 RepID=UPI003177AEA9